MSAARKPTINLGEAIDAELGTARENDPPPARPAAVPAARGQQRREPEPSAPAWDARMSLTLSKQMKRALDSARVDDGVEGTARIRAMITLWQDDERFRNRVDKLAKTLRT